MSRQTVEDLHRKLETSEPDPGFDAEFEAAVTQYRTEVRSAANRPEGFWDVQRASVLRRVAGPPPRPVWRVALVWAATVVFVVIVIGIVLDRPQAAPAPDLAAGYDQELLMDVERTLDQEVPEPLAPALLLTAEMEHGPPTRDAR